MRNVIAAGVVALGLSACVLSGCAAPTVWSPTVGSGTDSQRFSADTFECSQTARATAPGGSVAWGGLLWVVGASIANGVSTHNAKSEIYRECMTARGYVAETTQ
jgi:hypothetical protein